MSLERKLKVLLEQTIAATINAATPLLLAALGEVISQRSGVINIGIEGMMLMGALCGMSASFYTSGIPLFAPWIGILAAGTAGLLTAAIFAFLAIRLRGDQVIIGTAITLFALGFTQVVYQRLFGRTGSPKSVPYFQELELPILSQIPLIGQALFSHNIIVYLSFVLVPCVYFFLFHTQPGLRIRACGEHPKAISTFGSNVVKLRSMCLLFAGFMAGIGGGYLSLADVPLFTPGMTAGRGFTALAIVIFGKWHPVKAFGAALLFGLGFALDARFQASGWGVQYQWFQMLPYLLCLIVLTANSGKNGAGKTQAPLSLGKTYYPSA